ncbi:alkaline phosphatase family protein [Vibrio sp. S4M6]|uniref:alkaline phosphatase family protein n=1 Tax=Vibrio sinus TaxID=2946865 RepID=UPI00202ABCD5|nr:alkaline phosphatase family protein [Vibrio sinus]MCL9782420.1 alkaline phosphatase family protein [Vibrio sinus]
MAVIKKLAAAIGLFAVAGTAVAKTVTTPQPRTPIKHLVVLILQDQSFDRYFGIYPKALNLAGENAFHAAKDTPQVDGFTKQILQHNPNLSNPYRMAPQEPTCDSGHGVYAEKRSYNHGRNNMFIWKDYDISSGINDDGCFPNSVMGYYDGNSVTALWNYAQHYAMADHLFASNYTTEAGGMVDLIAGTNKGVLPKLSPGVSFRDSLIQDNPPRYDDASKGRFKVSYTRKNIGDLLNHRHVTWGYFSGGFQPSGWTKPGKAELSGKSLNSQGSLITNYQPISEPFQYFAATANPHHLPPSSIAMLGHSDKAHHQYDLRYFWKALERDQLPSVSFLSPKTGQSGRVGVSSPKDEQAFIVKTINHLMTSPAWKSTAVMIVWSYNDGWYDHVTPPNKPKAMNGIGYGPRLPFLLVSPWAKHNYVSHRQLDQGSVLKFIEYNWGLGVLGQHTADKFAHSLRGMFDFAVKPDVTPLILSPNTGLVRKAAS